MIDMEKIDKNNPPKSRIDHVPCICDICGGSFKTSVLNDFYEFCSDECFEKSGTKDEYWHLS